MPNELMLSELYLEPDELAALREIQQAGVLPDEHLQEELYSYFLRLGLIGHIASKKFPLIARVGDFIPLNAIALSDRGRSFLALQAQRDRDHAAVIAAALKEQTNVMANYAADQEKQHESDKAQRALEIRQARLDNWIRDLVCGTFGTAFGVFLTLLIEHFSEVMVFMKNLFS